MQVLFPFILWACGPKTTAFNTPIGKATGVFSETQDSSSQNTPETQKREMAERKAALEKRLQPIQKRKRLQKIPIRLLEVLVDQTPVKVQIQSLKVSKGLMLLSGVASSNADIALFLRNLDDSWLFSDVYLNTIENIDVDEVRLKKFVLQARLVVTAPEEKDSSQDAESSDVQRQIAVLESQVQSYKTKTAIEKEVQYIATISQKTSVDVQRFEEREERQNSQDKLWESPFETKLVGEFHNIAMFLDFLLQRKEVLYLEDLSIQIDPEDDEKVSLVVSFVLVICRLGSE